MINFGYLETDHLYLFMVCIDMYYKKWILVESSILTCFCDLWSFFDCSHFFGTFGLWPRQCDHTTHHFLLWLRVGEGERKLQCHITMHTIIRDLQYQQIYPQTVTYRVLQLSVNTYIPKLLHIGYYNYQ